MWFKMEKERKMEEFEDDRKKWQIYFDIELDKQRSENVIEVRFRRKENKNTFLLKEDIEKLKQDLKDLGKLRIIKQGKEFLKNCKEMEQNE